MWHATSLVASDGFFKDLSTGTVTVYVDFASLQQRKESYIAALIRKADKEKQENKNHIAEEQRRIKPEKPEEDPQIALIMAAMAQSMLKSGEWNQSGAWARVIGIGKKEIFLYQGYVPGRFVKTFDASAGFVVKYRRVPLTDTRGVLQQLDRWLRWKPPPSSQPGSAEETKC
ncbi:hypothetical protein IF1G_11053 [Cordyceps javanica]|uniref:Uncharacterized protein n=1 Tax=Cordyceps javanica TaxID=43265 RepID=A0A545VJ57_9HYPO|nr:hypothetical protein IF1G_11053 [Cordyceps javanica]TQW01762.1 hypothetical protein IF2G_10744 [Cordyceps javanica]